MDPKLLSQQTKTLQTIDIRFDQRSDQAILNQDCIDKYQENAYLLGRLFSVVTGAPKDVGTSEEEAKGVAVDTEVGDSAQNDDAELGELMN